MRLKRLPIRSCLMVSAAALLTVSGVFAGAAQALSLKEAVGTAIDSNPDIGQAIENREAIEFELRQARGLFLPRVDAEASAGARRFDSPGRRAIGRGDDTLSPVEAGVVATWKLYDGFQREAEVERQASRVDGASLRVLERSEFIALQVVKEYMEVALQARLVNVAQTNVSFHSGILGKIRQGEASGSLTVADRVQGEERLASAQARLVEARQELEAAKIRFFKLVGRQLHRVSMPGGLGARLPKSVDAALGIASRTNPRLKMAHADIDAAHALVKAAKGKYHPELFLEGRARTGRDIEGVDGRTNDVQGRMVMRWNLYNGGIDQANVQEQVRRVAEAQFARDSVLREIGEAIRLSWDRRTRQSELSRVLSGQLSYADRVVSAYDEQFAIGKRSLLDLLDAQNTRYNTQVLLETARTSAVFAEYRIMAATGRLVEAMGLRPPSQADAYARARANVPPTKDAETLPRYSPTKEKPWEAKGAL